MALGLAAVKDTPHGTETVIETFSLEAEIWMEGPQC